MLTVSGLSVDYGRARAVRDVSLTVRASQSVTIIGANGAGKTTLLRAISGLERCSAGKVTLAGEDATGAPAHTIARRGALHVPAGRQLFANMSVADNLGLGASARAKRSPDEIEADLEQLLDLFPVLRRRYAQAAGTLSGGEQQMLAIARALMARPRLLLLDEPSLGLAPLVLDEILESLRRLQAQRQLAILLVEQNAHFALEFASYAYVLEGGRVVGEGATEELRRRDDIQALYFGVETV